MFAFRPFEHKINFVDKINFMVHKINFLMQKKQFCDTKIIETFSNKEMLRTLVEKYSSPKKRNERLKIQKKALENLPGSYSGLIRSILDV